MKNYALILASGSGSRFGGDIPKQFLKIFDKTILDYSIQAFENNDLIDNIIVVVNEKYNEFAKELISKGGYKKVSKIVNGGKLRKDSSYNGINAIEENEANVLIHDAVRPLIEDKTINACIKALERNNAVAPATPCVDTVIKVIDNKIVDIPKRVELMNIQTPQCFKLSVIKKAHELSKNDNDFTDDCALILKHNLSDIFVVEGVDTNIKITHKKDIEIAEKIISNKINP